MQWQTNGVAVKKAKPSAAAYNMLKRKRDYTFEEWRAFYDHVFEKVAWDIFKNCKQNGLIKTVTSERDRYRIPTMIGNEIADIRQHLELHFYKVWLKFQKGSDKRIFPPKPGGFYLWNYHDCGRMFLGVAYRGTLRLDSIPHDVLMWKKNRAFYNNFIFTEFDDEREERLRVEKEKGTVRYFEEHLGVSLDDIFGSVFGFWWMGYSVREIADMLTVGNKYIGLKPKSISFMTVKRKLDETFEEIEAKLGINKKEMMKIRDEGIKRNRHAQKSLDP